MSDVLLVTCGALPDGEDSGHLLVEALRARGLGATWVAWDDPGVAWSSARLVAVRSAWDYEHQRDRFLAWARDVEAAVPLMNSAAVLAWNTDKRYLLDLVDVGLPVVPTIAVEDEGELPPAIASFETAVVKPRVGAGGRGVVVFDGEPGGPEGLDESTLEPGPWIVQPLVGSVRSEGETSVFVFGGEVASQVRTVPGAGEIRVHEEDGGRTLPVAVDEDAAALALRTVAAAEKVLGERLPYARVDLMRLADGELAVSELEVTEPGLYLDVLPGNADKYAGVLAAALDA